jgi:hypothetical protein
MSARSTLPIARDEWYAAKRPIAFRQPNGATGVHPLVSAIVTTSRSVISHAGELGLTPMSAARLGRQGVRRGPGRPVGANSAPDRKILPPQMRNDRPGVLRLAAASDAAAVNRARGRAGED